MKNIKRVLDRSTDYPNVKVERYEIGPVKIVEGILGWGAGTGTVAQLQVRLGHCTCTPGSFLLSTNDG
jgi:hypothetical protein